MVPWKRLTLRVRQDQQLKECKVYSLTTKEWAGDTPKEYNNEKIKVKRFQTLVHQYFTIVLIAFEVMSLKFYIWYSTTVLATQFSLSDSLRMFPIDSSRISNFQAFLKRNAIIMTIHRMVFHNLRIFEFVIVINKLLDLQKQFLQSKNFVVIMKRLSAFLVQTTCNIMIYYLPSKLKSYRSAIKLQADLPRVTAACHRLQPIHRDCTPTCFISLLLLPHRRLICALSIIFFHTKIPSN